MSYVRVSLTNPDNTVRFTAPYLPRLPREARALGGDFDKPRKEWVFPSSRLGEMNALLIKFYGTTGTDNPELCNVRVDLKVYGTTRRGLFALGREIANRDRQGVFRIGRGVKLVGGSHPQKKRDDDMIGPNDAVLIVENVPKALAEREIRMLGGPGPGGMEILSSAQWSTPKAVQNTSPNTSPNGWTLTFGDPLPSDAGELADLRKALLGRLAEVQKAIKSVGGDPDPEILKIMEA